jgi:uncharacterized phiE125 gp8 family phage protein
VGSPLDQLKRPYRPGYLASIKQTTVPDNSPLLLTVKSHLKITTTAEDTLLQIYIDAAVRYVEQVSRRSLFDQSWTLVLDSFPSDNKFDLYQGPVVSVTTFTAYNLANDPDATFSDYVLDIPGERILLNSGATWPTALRAHASVAVVYATGHGTTVAGLPSALLQAVLKLVGDFYVNRDEACTVTPESAFGVSTLLAGERRWRL